MTNSIEKMMRPPKEVMRLDRMGAAFPTRLSFMRVLVRRISRDNWQFSRASIELDAKGLGHAIYTVNTGTRNYSLIAFSHDLDPDLRNDRVIAEAWDATFNLFDGIPDKLDIERLANNTPKQEAGRFTSAELVLARANRSGKLFNQVIEALSAGKQPDIEKLLEVGYLMRTTAVYGNGKFGCADREKIADRLEVNGAFQVEMLAIYLIRLFSIDLVEHIAQRSSANACCLSSENRRLIGIGNATGLGMAPFLINHQALLHKWVYAKELALARVRSINHQSPTKSRKLTEEFKKARNHIAAWEVEDKEQMQRITALRNDLTRFEKKCPDLLHRPQPCNAIFLWVDSNLGIEARELTISILLECYPTLVDELGEQLFADEQEAQWDPSVTIAELSELLHKHYPWAKAVDHQSPEESHRIWYYSAEKLEPRLGTRDNNREIESEIPLAITRDVAELRNLLSQRPSEETTMQFCAYHPWLRHVVKRVQSAAKFPYGEIAGNLLSEEFRPIDILRFKLAYFGAASFDPKSSLWTRVTMYQGAPLPDDLDPQSADAWAFPLADVAPA